jgi:hypothetical protein
LLAVDLLAGPADLLAGLVAGEVDLQIEESRAGRPVDLRERRADGARMEHLVSDWRPSHPKSRRPHEGGERRDEAGGSSPVVRKRRRRQEAGAGGGCGCEKRSNLWR